MTDSTFAGLGLSQGLLEALAKAGHSVPTPIQAGAIPALLAGRDLLGLAQTGSGKTAAFTLPLLQQLAAVAGRPRAGRPRALILAPTRELAAQIAEAVALFARHGGLRYGAVYGGVPLRPQIAMMARGVDLLVATPGRLMDLMEQRHIALDDVRHLVLDEADRMLDMGFIPAVRKIRAALPANHQALLFSATMAPEVEKLAREMLRDPVRIEIARVAATAPDVDQHVYHVAKSDKRGLLEKLLGDPDLARVIVFTRTKHGADRVAGQLDRAGFGAEALHGNKSQSQRQRALERFRAGRARILVATDLAARGIDVSNISHVINFDLPETPETYVHRIGRTARAGASGVALSFCDAAEHGLLVDIEKSTGSRLSVAGGEPPMRAQPRPAAAKAPGRRPGRARHRHARKGHGGGGGASRVA